jgi:hypothetical protein
LGLIAIGVMAASRPVALHRLSLLATVFAIGAAASLAIPLLTLAGDPYTVSEEIMALQITAMLLFSLAVGYLTMFLRRAVQAPTAEAAPQFRLGDAPNRDLDPIKAWRFRGLRPAGAEPLSRRIHPALTIPKGFRPIWPPEGTPQRLVKVDGTFA